MVRHCMTFNQLYSLLPTQLSQNTSYVTAKRTIQCFLPVFRNKNNVIFAIMLYVSLALPVSHMASLLNLPVQRRPISYPARRFGRAFSSHTDRGGGLPRFNYSSVIGRGFCCLIISFSTSSLGATTINRNYLPNPVSKTPVSKT